MFYLFCLIYILSVIYNLFIFWVFLKLAHEEVEELFESWGVNLRIIDIISGIPIINTISVLFLFWTGVESMYNYLKEYYESV